MRFILATWINLCSPKRKTLERGKLVWNENWGGITMDRSSSLVRSVAIIGKRIGVAAIISRWRSLISMRLLPLLLPLRLVTWWELMRTSRVLRLIWSRSPGGVSWVRRGTRPIPLKTTRVVLWTVSFVTIWVAVLWSSPSIIGWSPCFTVITWRERSARIGSWISIHIFNLSHHIHALVKSMFG